MFEWNGDARRTEELNSRRFHGQVDGRRVPGVLFSPENLSTARPLILFGHGGGQFKEHAGVLIHARRWVQDHGFHVAAIDGPIHGERRPDAAFGPEVQAEFRAVWAQGNGLVDEMVADWRAAIDFLLAQKDIDTSRVGWFGLSMGSAYGIPLLAVDHRINCALLGMWGSDFVNSARLAEDAPAVSAACAFQMKWHDEFFSREGQFDLFDRLGSMKKTLKAFTGGHTPPTGEQFEDVTSYFSRHFQMND